MERQRFLLLLLEEEKEEEEEEVEKEEVEEEEERSRCVFSRPASSTTRAPEEQRYTRSDKPR